MTQYPDLGLFPKILASDPPKGIHNSKIVACLRGGVSNKPPDLQAMSVNPLVYQQVD